MRTRRLAKVLATAVAAAGAFAGSSALVSHSARPEEISGRPPMAANDVFRVTEEDAKKDRFHGSVHGWRLGTKKALQAEGAADRNLSLHCDATPAGAETMTQLDFMLTYLPPDIEVENLSGPDKWVCGGTGLSVMYDYNLRTRYGMGGLRAERAILGRRALPIYVAHDRVEAGSINGKPAIFAHPADDFSGLGHAVIIVIEDNKGPEYTILRLVADEGIPFAELVKIAEGAK